MDASNLPDGPPSGPSKDSDELTEPTSPAIWRWLASFQGPSTRRVPVDQMKNRVPPEERAMPPLGSGFAGGAQRQILESREERRDLTR